MVVATAEVTVEAGMAQAEDERVLEGQATAAVRAAAVGAGGTGQTRSPSALLGPCI